LDRRSVRHVGDAKDARPNLSPGNFVAVKRGHAFRIRGCARDLDVFLVTARTVIPTTDCASDILVARMINAVGVRFCVNEIARANDRADSR
jgi:hypothetical protein